MSEPEGTSDLLGIDSMDQWCDKVAFVTGGNSGIGLATVELLLDMSMTVIAVDKDLGNLEALKNDGKHNDNSRKLHYLNVNLINEEEIVKAFQWTENNLGGINVLINNAGVGGVSSLLESTAKEWRCLLDVNVFAFGLCIREAVSLMRKSKITNGQIINITSNLAHYVPRHPPFHFYSATKHAAKALVEGFRQELLSIDPPIRITSISPGFVKTGIIKSSQGDAVDKYLYDNYPSIDAQDISSAIKYILETPMHVTINEIAIRPTGSEN